MLPNLRSYKNIYDNNIILMHKGELTFDLVTSLIETLEGRINAIEPERKVQRVFYSVVTECIQNLYYHMDEVRDEDVISTYDSRSGLILVMARKRFFRVLTGNFIPNYRIPTLQNSLDKINSMDYDELRDYYKDILSDGKYSEKGTAGLGFVEIAKKTKSQLQYSFQQITDEYSYFTFQVRISRVVKTTKTRSRVMA
ncbi:MAG: SiaB family protein kinase [Bacteroidota bacterium]